MTISEILQEVNLQGFKASPNPLKFHPLWPLVPVHGCNLALLPDSRNA